MYLKSNLVGIVGGYNVSGGKRVKSRDILLYQVDDDIRYLPKVDADVDAGYPILFRDGYLIIFCFPTVFLYNIERNTYRKVILKKRH